MVLSKSAAKMLVLFETPAGYAIFKVCVRACVRDGVRARDGVPRAQVVDERKLQRAAGEDLFRDFETPEAANKV